MASSRISGKETPLIDSRASGKTRRRQPQTLPFLSKEKFSRSVSVQFAPTSLSKRTAESRTYISSIEPIHLKPQSPAAENSYQMKPTVLFPSSQVETIARDMLGHFLEGKTYDEDTCKQLSMDICNEIQTKIKRLNVPRYKFVCYVHIGQLLGQDIVIASRCLWDTNVDNSASVNYKNNHLFATASVFGFYYE